MENNQIDIQNVLALLRETIGNQAQEIAVLRASILAMQSGIEEEDKV